MSKPSRSFLRQLDKLIANDELDAALEAISTNYLQEGWNDEVITRLEKIATTRPIALLNLAGFWFERNSPEGDQKAHYFYRQASQVEDDEVAGPAWFALGAIELRNGGGPEEIRPYLSRSAEAGFTQAQLTYGQMLLDESVAESNKDKAKRALSFLQRAVDDGDMPEAKVFVAQSILDGSIRGGKYDPMMLLSEAAMQKDEEAMSMLMYLTSPQSNRIPTFDSILPYIVKPESLKRARLVRDAIHQEFDLPASAADEIVAGLFGCPTWARLVNVCGDNRVPPGKFDEDLSAAELNERKKLQAGILLHFFDMPPHVADVAVELLKPSSRSGDKPSLKRLEEKARTMTFKFGMNEPAPIAARAYDERGLKLDIDSALRFGFRVRPEIWLTLLETRFGWRVTPTDYDVSGEGVKVATVTVADGLVDLYMSRVSHRPGDQGDEHVENLLRKIGDQSKRAILLFNMPIAHLPEDESAFGLLYGGKVKTDSTGWYDFVLRPMQERGAEDAIGQKLRFKNTPEPEITNTYGFDQAGNAAIGITQSVRNELDIRYRAITLREGHWQIFVPAEIAASIRTMQRMG